MRVRKLLIGLAAAAAAVVVGAVGADFGAAIYAEYRLARTLRSAAGLAWDPSVAILGFPFIPQAMRHHYDEVELRASGVDHAVVGKASLEATLHSIDLTEASWLVRPDAKLPVGKAESRIIIDSTHVGRFMGINDLLVEAPSRETNDATGGTTESGISSNRGLVFTGTPKAADFDEKVSVAVDLSIVGPDQTTLVFTATGVLTGAGTADQQVPEDKTAAVLAAFSTSMPGQKLPFGLAPTSEGARGSDIIIEGIAEGVTDHPGRVHTVMSTSLVAAIAALIAALGVAYVIGRLLDAAGRAAERDRRRHRGGHHRPGVVAHRADRGAFQCGLVRAVRRGATSGQSGGRRPARRRPRRDRHGRQSRGRPATFGALAADHVHLRPRRTPAVPNRRACPRPLTCGRLWYRCWPDHPVIG